MYPNLTITLTSIEKPTQDSVKEIESSSIIKVLFLKKKLVKTII